MDCDLIAPFRLQLDLPTRYIRAFPDQWASQWRQANRALAARQDLGEASLGNYGWALRDQDKALYGTEGRRDPGFFFREHHLLLLQGEACPPPSPAPALSEDGAPLALAGARWECRLYDNHLAVLVFSLRSPDLAAISACTPQGREAYTHWTDQWLEHQLDLLCQGQDALIPTALAWLDRTLIAPFTATVDAELNARTHRLRRGRHGRSADEARTDILGLTASPIYQGTGRRLWTHHAYCIEATDGLQPDAEAAPVAEGTASFIGAELLDAWRQQGANLYSWGGSIRSADPELDRQWREAASVSQYYYSCLDIADTALPMEIARQQVANTAGEPRRVLADIEQINNQLHMLEHDYADIRARSACEAGAVLNGYHDSWHIDDLLRSLDNKLDTLRQLTSSAHNRVQQHTDDMMNVILFTIGVLGLISLFTGLHDYLSGGVSTRFYDELPELALGLGKSDVLMGALLVTLAALAWFFWYRRSK